MFEACDAGEECKLTPGNSTPHCRSTNTCTTTLEKLCLDMDLSAVYYVDSCGAIEGTFETCGAGEECKLTPGSSTPHCRSTNTCVVHILQEALVAYDIATGDRTAVSVAGSVGAGDLAMGENNIFWDDSRNLMWVMGQVAPFLGFAVDLTTGDRDSVYRISPGGLLPGEYPVELGHAGALRAGNYVGYGTAALHPTDNNRLYLIGTGGEMYEYEISTGNSWIKSL